MFQPSPLLWVSAINSNREFVLSTSHNCESFIKNFETTLRPWLLRIAFHYFFNINAVPKVLEKHGAYETGKMASVVFLHGKMTFGVPSWIFRNQWVLLSVDYLWVIYKENLVPSCWMRFSIACHRWAPSQEHWHAIQDPFFADTLTRITSRLCQAILCSPLNHDSPNSVTFTPPPPLTSKYQGFHLEVPSSFKELFRSIYIHLNSGQLYLLPLNLKNKEQ